MKEGLFISSGRNDSAAVDYLNGIFEKAIELNAADIHFQQTDRHARVRVRIPGSDLIVLNKDIPLEWMEVFDEKIRSKAEISITDHRSPFDGRLSLSAHGVDIDVRVAITPGVFKGQLIVCRLLKQSNSNIQLDDIEMTLQVREAYRDIIREPNGLFLVTGPTGSGKTTTLYALLNALNDPSRNIITIENPVEYRIPDFHQINVDQHISFADALRAVLRQDPDVILIGEIRDKETADIAIQSAITGHLVLATLHANNAPNAITRLIDMGVDPTTIVSALRGVSAQRLVRKIKDSESTPREKPSSSDLKWMKLNGIRRHNPMYPAVSDLIDGFSGVAPVMELIIADSRVKKAIDKGETAIYAAASRQAQFETIAQASERLAYLGVTTMMEARRLTSEHDVPVIKNRRVGQILVDMGIVDEKIMCQMLEKQINEKGQGVYRNIGDILLEEGLVSESDLWLAIGHTDEAADILRKLCTNEDKKLRLVELLAKWNHGEESLLELATMDGLVTKEQLRSADYI